MSEYIEIEADNCDNDIGSREKNQPQQMLEDMKKICDLLSDDKVFLVERLAIALIEYSEKHKRLSYATVSSYIFADSRKDKTGDNIMQNNIEHMLTEVLSQDFQNKINSYLREKEKNDFTQEQIEECIKIVYKLHDHISLAIQQVENLKFTDQKYQEKFEEKIEPVISREEQAMQTKMEGLAKDMTSQLVSLVGIFTAIAFIIFGSISEFNNIFSGLNDTSLLKLLMVGSVWGICLINLVYVFLFCIGKMTGLNFRSVQKSAEATVFQKYPIVWWSNLIVISILIVSTWLYFIMYRTNAVVELLNLSTQWIVGISGVIIAIIIAAVCLLYKKCNSQSVKK